MVDDRRVISRYGRIGHGCVGVTPALNSHYGSVRTAPRILGFVDDYPTETNVKSVRRPRRRLPRPDPIGFTRPTDQHPRGARRRASAVASRDRSGHARYGLPAATVVHPAAEIGPDCLHQQGLFAAGRRPGDDNVLLGWGTCTSTRTARWTETVLGDYVSVNPLAAVLPGTARLEDASWWAPRPRSCRSWPRSGRHGAPALGVTRGVGPGPWWWSGVPARPADR